MTAHAPAGGGTAAGSAAAPAARGRGWLQDLVRAAAAPVLCAAVLIGLLSAWVGSGGAGTISRVKVEITRAAIPMTSFTAGSAPAGGSRDRAAAYLTIRNLSAAPDELLRASSPGSRQVLLARRGPGAALTRLPGLSIPAGGEISLSPFGPDLVLTGASALTAGQQVPLTLVFRNAGRVTVMATVTPPGSP
jgi:copper(I)-binding protein